MYGFDSRLALPVKGKFIIRYFIQFINNPSSFTLINSVQLGYTIFSISHIYDSSTLTYSTNIFYNGN